MERTDRQENNIGGERPPRILDGLPVARSAAGAGRFLRGGRNRLDVPEARGPGYSVPVGPDDVGFTDLDAAVQVCATKARTLQAVVILHHISGSGCVYSVLMSVVTLLYGFLTADNYGLRVGIPLRHRSGAAPDAENSNDDNDDDQEEPLLVIVIVSHF